MKAASKARAGPALIFTGASVSSLLVFDAMPDGERRYFMGAI